MARARVATQLDIPLNREMVRTTLDAEIVAAYARKTSFETRSGLLVAGSVGLVTIFLALREQLEISAELAKSPHSSYVVAGLAMTGLTLVAALLTSMPWNYPITDGHLLRVLLGEVEKGYELRAELLAYRAKALVSMTRSNTIKACTYMIGVIALIATVFCFAVAILGVEALI